jgi:hypothetical protein
LKRLEKIGEFSAAVVELLALDVPAGTAIYVGTSNIAHIARKHPLEFNRFFNKIPYIIKNADYVRFKADDGSIEYIKFFGKHVKIAVRIAGDGEYYVRSLHYVELNRIENLIKKGELKPLTK